jgi:hypothetical protein
MTSYKNTNDNLEISFVLSSGGYNPDSAIPNIGSFIVNTFTYVDNFYEKGTFPIDYSEYPNLYTPIATNLEASINLIEAYE